MERRNKVRIMVRDSGNVIEYRTNDPLITARREAEDMVEKAGGLVLATAFIETPRGAKYQLVPANAIDGGRQWIRVDRGHEETGSGASPG